MIQITNNNKNSENEEDRFYNKLKLTKRTFKIKKLPKERLKEIMDSVGGDELTEEELRDIEKFRKERKSINESESTKYNDK